MVKLRQKDLIHGQRQLHKEQPMINTLSLKQQPLVLIIGYIIKQKLQFPLMKVTHLVVYLLPKALMPI